MPKAKSEPVVVDQASKQDEKMLDLPIVGKQPVNEKEEKYLKEICEFEFYNTEEPGLSIKFPYGNTKKNHSFTFEHGSKYRIPRHVARHVESSSTPIYSWKPNGSGAMQKIQTGTKSRFQMRPVFE
jgi:hypothetical protein